ncbi:MAG: MerR family transcriptional regulator [Desulfarculus sp.]|nr:MerR family transcriptional regulator [Desulfarculus sp.]
MDRPRLPEKPYFRIGEVAELLGVETYVLRYWESEFPQLRPVRAPSRQRLYRRADVETLVYIKGLLHEQGYTIAGAKRRLAEVKAAQPAPPAKGQQRLALVPPSAEPAPSPPPQDQPASQAPPPVVKEVLDELRDLLKKLS